MIVQLSKILFSHWFGLESSSFLVKTREVEKLVTMMIDYPLEVLSFCHPKLLFGEANYEIAQTFVLHIVFFGIGEWGKLSNFLNFMLFYWQTS